MPERDTSLSKFLSFVLRHEPGAIGVVLDEGGWLHVDRLLSALAEHGRELSLTDLEQLVRGSDKQRFAFSPDGSMIRANQGHSVRVKLGYQAVAPPNVLFHGTVARFLPSIRERGLLKGGRHHVHLSATPELATWVARRRGAPLVLEVAAAEMALPSLVHQRHQRDRRIEELGRKPREALEGLFRLAVGQFGGRQRRQALGVCDPFSPIAGRHGAERASTGANTRQIASRSGPSIAIFMPGANPRILWRSSLVYPA